MKKPTRAERLARAAEDELPYAAQSGLTTSLIAGAQPQNALVDRRIYQPSLASTEAMNPDPRLGRSGFINAMQDVYADPGRMLPGSGGWTEGVGAALPHLGAAAFDPAGAMLGGLAGRAAAPVVRGAMRQAPAMKNAMGRLVSEEHGHLNIDPHFRPTGRAKSLVPEIDTPPTIYDQGVYDAVESFRNNARRGDWAAAMRDEGKLWEIMHNQPSYSNSPQSNVFYEAQDALRYIEQLRRMPKLTRQAPGIRSSNSNAPTIGGGPQPDPFAPTLSPRRSK